MKKTYGVVIRKTGHTYTAYAPDFPDCVAAGRTAESTKKNLAMALRRQIKALMAEGKQVPEPAVTLRYVEVPEPPARKSA